MLLSPLYIYRKFANGAHQIDGGLYYTFKDIVTLGGSYRTGGAVGLTGALRINNNILLGYSREVFPETLVKAWAPRMNLHFGLDFRDHNYYTKKKNAREISTKALALRRKTISTYSKGSPYSRVRSIKRRLNEITLSLRTTEWRQVKNSRPKKITKNGVKSRALDQRAKIKSKGSRSEYKVGTDSLP